MIRRIGFIATAIVFAVTLASVGYWMLFSNFAVYDDEGYILLSAREYLLHGKLYESVYSQYGPASYVLIDGFQRLLGSPIDHTWARLLTLGFWLGAAGSCALLVWRETASRSLSLFTLSATFLFLYFITDEPFHPGSLIFFVLAASSLAITGRIRAGKLASAAAIAGTTGAFLFLTKINVGAFYIAGVCSWAVVHSVSDRLRRIAHPFVIVFLILLAIGLMHTLLREAWVQIYLLLFASGAIALVFAIKGRPLIKPVDVRWFLVGSVGLGLTVPALIWLRGTALAGVIDGVVLGPLRHPGNYSYAVDWRPGSLAVAGLSLLFAILYPWFRKRFSDETTDRLIVTVRLILATALLMGVAALMNLRAVGAIFSYVAPLIWLWVIPLRRVEQSSSARMSRELLAMVLLLQFLHAYPVGGSQESWGAFLFIPLVALGLGDVRRWFLIHKSNSPTPCWWPRLAALIVAVVTVKVASTAIVAHRHYAALLPLDLPGATQLRLPESQRTAYRIFALNAVIHADMLFSLPGMFSFNLWTGLPTPTEKNTTLWITLLNNDEQRAIIQTLEQTPRAGLIVQETLIALMQTNHVPLSGPLWDYLHQNFSAVFRSEGFAFWVHKGRTVVPFNIATVGRPTAADSNSGLYDTQIEFYLAQNNGVIASIEVRNSETEHITTKRLDGSNSAVNFTSINSSGEALMSPTSMPWPLECKGLARVRIRFNRDRLTLSPFTTILYLKGSKGKDLGEVRIRE